MLSIPNTYRNILSIQHKEKLSIPHIKKVLVYMSYGQYIRYINVFMSILGIEKLSILCIDNKAGYRIVFGTIFLYEQTRSS